MPFEKIKTVAIYARVSTDDQSCERQVNDLVAYANKLGYRIYLEPFIETASGAKNDRKQRNHVLTLARARKIDGILVTELTRWGRSLSDLMSTLQELETRGVSLIPITGMAFDFSTAQGKLMGTIMAAFSEFERDLIRERTKSGLAAARARGKELGRKKGDKFVQRKYEKEILKLNKTLSVRKIASALDISPTTVQAVLTANKEKVYN